MFEIRHMNTQQSANGSSHLACTNKVHPQRYICRYIRVWEEEEEEKVEEEEVEEENAYSI